MSPTMIPEITWHSEKLTVFVNIWPCDLSPGHQVVGLENGAPNSESYLQCKRPLYCWIAVYSVHLLPDELESWCLHQRLGLQPCTNWVASGRASGIKFSSHANWEPSDLCLVWIKQTVNCWLKMYSVQKYLKFPVKHVSCISTLNASMIILMHDFDANLTVILCRPLMCLSTTHSLPLVLEHHLLTGNRMFQRLGRLCQLLTSALNFYKGFAWFTAQSLMYRMCCVNKIVLVLVYTKI